MKAEIHMFKIKLWLVSDARNLNFGLTIPLKWHHCILYLMDTKAD